MDAEKRDHQLKHLGFVRAAAIAAVVSVANLYNYAKDNAGPLRSVVGAIEGVVVVVVEPVYRKFHGVPDEVLAFLNLKICEGEKGPRRLVVHHCHIYDTK